MSHLYEVGIDGQQQGFQSLALLDHSTLATLVTAGADPSLCAGALFEDEGDLFQCGRCKRQFTSLPIFMHHKREGCVIVSSPSPSYLTTKEPLHLGNLKTSASDLSTGHHYITENGLISDSIDGKTFDSASVNGSVLSTIGFSGEEQQEDDQIGDQTALEEENHPNSSASVIHMQPSIVLSDETLSFTIPVDQNSSLGQLLAAGANGGNTVLTIPEHELAALISAGERFQISSGDSANSINPNGFYLTASIVPSHLKDVNSKLSDDSQEYSEISEDQFDSSIVHLKKEAFMNGEIELVSRYGKAAPGTISAASVAGEESGNVIRLKNYGTSNATNVGNPRVVQKSNKKTPSATSTNNSHLKNAVASSSNSKNQESVPECKRKCEYCGKPFKKLFNLMQHIRSHTGEKPFHCLVCGRGFTQKSNVKKHMQTHKVWPKVKYTLPKEQISVKVKENSENSPVDVSNGESKNVDNVEYIVNNVYVCQYCDQHFENYHKLKTHLSHTHKNEKLFKCIHKDCMATFLEVEGLISHMKTHEDQIEYQCYQCPKKFKNLYDLGAHQYTHRLQPNNKVTANPPKQFRCTKCNSKYASAEALNHHLLTSSHNYPCSQCSLTFVCERYLRRHLRIHGTVEPFKCDICFKMFKTENYLKSHLVIHSDSKPFHCEICKQSFNRRDKLTRHKLMHDNRKKYKCPFKNTGCEREFYRKDKLKDHMTSHNRKVYACKCGKTFSWPVRLRKHQAQQHPEMLVSTTCPTCQKIFKTKHHLKIHVCKSNNAVTNPLTNDINISVANNAEDDNNLQVGAQNPIEISESVLDGDMNKVVVLYHDCEISEAHDPIRNRDKCGTGIMLGSFTSSSDDPESVIFARYSSSECEDKEVCQDLDGNEEDDTVIGPIEMTWKLESGVESHIDQLIATD